MLWRFSANNTHLYPGAVLRSLIAPNDARLTSGDTLLLEFSDGVLVSGLLPTVQPDEAVLEMPDYRTQHGTTVAARAWRLAPSGEPGLIRVHERLPEA